MVILDVVQERLMQVEVLTTTASGARFISSAVSGGRFRVAAEV